MVFDNLPSFSVRYKEVFALYRKRARINKTTLMKYIGALLRLSQRSERKHSELLPIRFVVMLDRCSNGETPFDAVFVAFPVITMEMVTGYG